MTYIPTEIKNNLENQHYNTENQISDLDYEEAKKKNNQSEHKENESKNMKTV